MTERITTAGALIVNNKVFLARRTNCKNFNGYWEVPGGKKRDSESVKEALVREFDEEFSFDIEVNDLILESEFINKETLYKLKCFTVSLLSDTEPNLSFHSEVAFFDKEELKTLDIIDSDKPIIDILVFKYL